MVKIDDAAANTDAHVHVHANVNIQRVWCPLPLPQRPVAPLNSLAQPRVQTSLGRQGGGGGGRRQEEEEEGGPGGAGHQAGQQQRKTRGVYVVQVDQLMRLTDLEEDILPGP